MTGSILRGVRTAVAAAAVLGLVACESTTTEPERNLVETAQAAGQFDTLLTAATAAGLADELARGGPYTLFAPTDAAFGALPAGTVEALLADRAALRAVLLYHVVEGRVTAGQAAGLSAAPTLNGRAVPIVSSGGQLRVGGARVVQADVGASNGIIHVVDAVMIP
jgi:uncharacterized surface protein with fasciclin (FAS1) repeats